MKTVPTKCKVCDKEIILKVDLETPQVWLDKLVPMATCNNCYDAVDLYRGAEESIRKLCGKLRNVRLDHRNVLTDAEIDAFKKALKFNADKYARAVAAFHGQTLVLYVDVITGMFWDKPADWWKSLAQFRNEAAAAYRTPSLNPFDRLQPKDPEPSFRPIVEAEYQPPMKDP